MEITQFILLYLGDKYAGQRVNLYIHIFIQISNYIYVEKILQKKNLFSSRESVISFYISKMIGTYCSRKFKNAYVVRIGSI